MVWKGGGKSYLRGGLVGFPIKKTNDLILELLLVAVVAVGVEGVEEVLVVEDHHF